MYTHGREIDDGHLASGAKLTLGLAMQYVLH